MYKDLLRTAYTYKSGSLLKEFKTIIKNWDLTKNVKENIYFLENNDVFGKNTQSWKKEIIHHFKRRLIDQNDNFKNSIGTFKKCLNSFKDQLIINTIICFHLCLADLFFQRVLIDFLHVKRKNHFKFIRTADMIEFIDTLALSNSIPHHYSKEMKKRIARGVLSTLKDLGLVTGSRKKTINPVYLPDECIIYFLYWFKSVEMKPREIINHYIWHVFSLSAEDVEKIMFHIHDLRFIAFYQVGDIYRIDWKYNTILEVLQDFGQR